MVLTTMMVCGEQQGTLTRYLNKLYMLYDELDIAKVMRNGRWAWLGHLWN
jgi:uncharacterized metal-binding protein